MVENPPPDWVRISFVLSGEDWERLCRLNLTPANHLDMLGVFPHEYTIESVEREGYESGSDSGGSGCSGDSGPALPE